MVEVCHIHTSSALNWQVFRYWRDVVHYLTQVEQGSLVPGKKTCIFCDEKSVCLVLAPFNFKPFTLVGAMPHAFWLGCYPIHRARFAAQRDTKFVGAAQHAVIARL